VNTFQYATPMQLFQDDIVAWNLMSVCLVATCLTGTHCILVPG